MVLHHGLILLTTDTPVLSESLCSQSFHTSLVIRFTSGCGQLPFTLCAVAIAVYVCVYASICGARIKRTDHNFCDGLCCHVVGCSGYGRRVNRWFHAVRHSQNTEPPNEKKSADLNLVDQVPVQNPRGFCNWY